MSLYIKLTIAYIFAAILSVYSYGFGVLFAASFFVVNLTACIIHRKVLTRFVLSCFFLLGVFLMSGMWYANSAQLCGLVNRYVIVDGVIIDVPDEAIEYNSYTVQTRSISYRGEEIKLKQKIRVTSDMRFETGNRLKLKGFIKELGAPDNSTEYDYRLDYRRKGISYRMHAEEAELVAARTFMFSPTYWGNYIKSRIAFAIDKFYTGDCAALMKAVLLAEKSNFSESFHKVLVKSAALRFLHPSYMHMFLIIAVCEFLFVLFRKRKNDAVIVAVLVFCAIMDSDFYCFSRLVITLSASLIYCRIRGFKHYPDLIAITILALIIANPMNLCAAWFIISITSGILQYAFYRQVVNRMHFSKNKVLLSSVATWLIGTIGTMPIFAYFFNGTPLYGILFSLVYIPLSLALFIIAPITLLLYELTSNAWVFGIACDAILDTMKVLPEMISKLPGYYLSLGKTTLMGFVIFYGALYVVRLMMMQRYREKRFFVASALCVVLFAVYVFEGFTDVGNMYVRFVNVGQGDGAVIEIKGKDTILMDGGGGENSYNIGENIYLPYITAMGINRVDLAIVSHAHRDHADGIIAAVENLRVHTLMLAEVDDDDSYRKKIIDAAEENGTEIIYVSAGDRLDFKSGLVIEVLSPNRNYPSDDENENSLVLKMSYGDTDLLFCGDIGFDTENALAGKIGQVEVVKAPHHGSRYSSGKDFAAELKPEYTVFCAGTNNMYAHPTKQAMTNFGATGSEILRTDTMGDIHIKADRLGIIDVEVFKEESQWQ